MKEKKGFWKVIVFILVLLLALGEGGWIVVDHLVYHTETVTGVYLSEKEIAEGLQDDCFEVWYQPIVDSNGVICSAEALSRYRSPDGTVVSPAMFIPVMEGNGTVEMLDLQVFAEVCEMQKERLAEGKECIPVSMNISRCSLTDSEIFTEYKNILESSAIPVDLVILEITETVEMDTEEMYSALVPFSEYGFTLEIDDFGSGYSTFENLLSVDYDGLKIDKSIVDQCETDDGENVITAILEMAENMNMYVITEGVETASQAEILIGLGCEQFQGYYYSAPVEYSDLVLMLDGEEK